MVSRRRLAAIVISLALGLVGLELVTAAYFSLSGNRGFIYKAKVISAPHNQEQSTPVTRFYVSPYLGFVRAPHTPLREIIDYSRLEAMAKPDTTPAWFDSRTNNHGFLSRRDYPVQKVDPKDFVIGLFGGSVAQNFALQGEAALFDALRQEPGLRTRNLILVNLSSGGYKQPQQLLALCYYLSLGQSFDFVINIDGFNELALAALNQASNIAPSMPDSQQMVPLANLATISSDVSSFVNTARLLELREAVADNVRRQKNCFSALCHAWHALDGIARTRRYQSMLQMVVPQSPQSLVQLQPAQEEHADITSYIAIWRRSTQAMHALLASQRTPYLHVLQPNQYVSKHRFSSEERKVALNPKSGYRAAIEQGYPKLRDDVMNLRTNGFPIVDASKIFDDEDTWVFSDDCCHYNQTGNELLARVIATAATDVIQQREPLRVASPAADNSRAR